MEHSLVWSETSLIHDAVSVKSSYEQTEDSDVGFALADSLVLFSCQGPTVAGRDDAERTNDAGFGSGVGAHSTFETGNGSSNSGACTEASILHDTESDAKSSFDDGGSTIDSMDVWA